VSDPFIVFIVSLFVFIVYFDIIGTDIHCGYHQGLPYSCEESEKNALQSPQESGCSSTDDEDEEEDEDDEEEDEDGDEYEDDDEDENGDGDLDEHDHHLLSKSLIEIKGTMKSTEIPDSLKKAFDGFQNITKAEQLATKQQLLEKLPSLLRKEKVSVPASVNILHQTFVTQGLKTCCLSLPRY